MRYALIDATGLVYNIAEWDGESEWDHGAAQCIQSDEANIGWTYADGVFAPPPPGPIPPEVLYNPEFDKGNTMYEILTG